MTIEGNLSPVFQVSEFNELVNRHLTLLGVVQVEGEISQINHSLGKFLFITLKDEHSTLSVFGMSFQLYNWKELEIGMKVSVSGTANLHQKSSRFSLSAQSITPIGEGNIATVLLKLEQKLKTEGLFDESRKRPIPKLSLQVGLITGQKSQAYQDFVKIANSRLKAAKITFFPTIVQGNQAVESIVTSLVLAQKYPLDVLVLTRGGGSIEDLIAFNDERVVRQVFASKIPIVCAIGHEGDSCLAEKAADLRASTPSNAAELVFADKTSLTRQLENSINKLKFQLQLHLSYRRSSLVSLAHENDLNINIFVDKISKARKQLGQASISLNRLIDSKLLSLETSKKYLDHWCQLMITTKSNEVREKTKLLESYSIEKVLSRGFSLTLFQGKIIKEANRLKTNQQLETRLAKGKVYSIITHTKP